MADEPCVHCGERHAATTPFCPNTGKPLSRAPEPPRASANLPSWVAQPQTSAGTDPGAAAAPAGATGVWGSGEKGVLDLLQQAFALYKNHAKLLLTVAAVVFIPGAIAHACATAAILGPTVAVSVAMDPLTHAPYAAPIAVGSVVAGFTAVMLGLLAAAVTGLFLHGIIVPLTEGALAIAAADRLAGGTATWREIWTWLFRRLGTVLSAVIPAALLIGAGFFFMVVPGLILAFFFAFVPIIALFEGVGGMVALRRSFALVRSDWLRMLLVTIVFGLVSAAASFVAGLMPVGLFGTRLLQDALTLLAMPIPVLGSVLLYFDVRRKHDPQGFSEQQLAREMDVLRGTFRADPVA